jgi:hypothetical protein
MVMVPQHPEDTERRPQTPELMLERGRAKHPAGEIARDEDEVRGGRHGEVDRLAHGAHIETRGEAGVEVRELHDREAIEVRRAGRRPQASVHAADPLRLVQKIRGADSGGRAERGGPQTDSPGSVQTGAEGSLGASSAVASETVSATASET